MNVLESSIIRAFEAQNGESLAHAEQARHAIPTGTSRALLRHVPFTSYTDHASGVFTTDIDGNRRIDFHGNYTALIHGHAHPSLIEAVHEQLPRGTAYSAPPVQEQALAEHLASRVAAVDQVVFNNSGSEAVMVALRAARAITGRDKIVKFEGAYHGSSDFVMVGGHGLPAPDDPCAISSPKPDVGGIPQAATRDVVLVRYNDPDAIRTAISRHAAELAAVIVEPMLGAGGLIAADPDFMAVVREETSRAGIVLICDEVITLRQAVGGAQSFYDLEPDLTTMAKIIGGGFPIGAVGGKRSFMACFEDPALGGTVANLGTFSANPVSTNAGLAAMELLDERAIANLNDLGARLRTGLRDVIARHDLGAQITGDGSLFHIHWTREPLTDTRAVETANEDLKLLTFLGLANRGFQISIRGLCCLSTPMTTSHADDFVAAFEDTVTEIAAEGWPIHGDTR